MAGNDVPQVWAAGRGTWALDTINILLYDDNSIMTFSLSQVSLGAGGTPGGPGIFLK